MCLQRDETACLSCTRVTRGWHDVSVLSELALQVFEVNASIWARGLKLFIVDLESGARFMGGYRDKIGVRHKKWGERRRRFINVAGMCGQILTATRLMQTNQMIGSRNYYWHKCQNKHVCLLW